MNTNIEDGKKFIIGLLKIKLKTLKSDPFYEYHPLNEKFDQIDLIIKDEELKNSGFVNSLFPIALDELKNSGFLQSVRPNSEEDELVPSKYLGMYFKYPYQYVINISNEFNKLCREIMDEKEKNKIKKLYIFKDGSKGYKYIVIGEIKNASIFPRNMSANDKKGWADSLYNLAEIRNKDVNIDILKDCNIKTLMSINYNKRLKFYCDKIFTPTSILEKRANTITKVIHIETLKNEEEYKKLENKYTV